MPPSSPNTPTPATWSGTVLSAHGIPVPLHDGLVRYLVDGIKPGSFLTAVLENNLLDAVTRANPEAHFQSLPTLLRFLANHVPTTAWGSRAAVVAWSSARRKRRDPANVTRV